MTDFDVIVVGGGASGAFAAISAAQQNKRVLLVEKNKFLGRKLRITGKGRCNLTNYCDAETFFSNVVSNPKFMYSSFYSFDNYAVYNFFEERGVPLKVERGNRVFPVSDKASDIVDCLTREINKLKIKVIRDTVRDIIVENNTVRGIKLSDKVVYGKSVIIATGGVSYPVTGSTGDGYRFAVKCGHNIIAPEPSLVPIVCHEKICKELQGLSLKNISVTLFSGDKYIFDDFGEMIFTHYGVSGPVILSLSAHIVKNSENFIILDLKPALSFDELDKRILKDFQKYINKDFINSLSELLPVKLIPVVIELSGIDPRKKVNAVTKEERNRLVETIKNIKLTVKGLRPVDEAVITSGGISVKDINPSTMESKIVNNLYFCGEVIDVDAYTGGFNLQIAFSTGYLAGISAADN